MKIEHPKWPETEEPILLGQKGIFVGLLDGDLVEETGIVVDIFPTSIGFKCPLEDDTWEIPTVESIFNNGQHIKSKVE